MADALLAPAPASSPLAEFKSPTSVQEVPFQDSAIAVTLGDAFMFPPKAIILVALLPAAACSSLPTHR